MPPRILQRILAWPPICTSRMLYPPQFNLFTKVERAVICFLDLPITDKMKCKAHPNGCGQDLQEGDIIKVCGEVNTKLVAGKVWYFLARRMNGTKHHCYVGVVKVLVTQAHLVANRYARVVEKHDKEEVDKTNRTKNLKILCQHADIEFVDSMERSE